MPWTPPAADPNFPLNKFMAPVPRYARYAALSCALLMTAISWLTYTGVYRWIAEAQLALMQSFEMHITFIFTILAYAIFFGIAARIMVSAKILPRATPEEAAKVLEANAKMHHGRFSPLMIIIMLLPLTIVGLICGIYSKWAASIKSPTIVTMAEIDGGNKPRGTWLEVTGYITDSHLQYGDQYKPDYYTPLITPSWDPSKPLVVMIESKEALRPGLITLKGMRWPLGVPGPVRAIFERNGVNADDAILIQTPDGPQDWVFPGNFLTIGAGLGMAACGAAFFFGRREKHDQQLPNPTTTPQITTALPQDIHSH
jgi:hypothetical protein